MSIPSDAGQSDRVIKCNVCGNTFGIRVAPAFVHVETARDWDKTCRGCIAKLRREMRKSFRQIHEPRLPF